MGRNSGSVGHCFLNAALDPLQPQKRVICSSGFLNKLRHKVEVPRTVIILEILCFQGPHCPSESLDFTFPSLDHRKNPMKNRRSRLLI